MINLIFKWILGQCNPHYSLQESIISPVAKYIISCDKEALRWSNDLLKGFIKLYCISFLYHGKLLFSDQ